MSQMFRGWSQDAVVPDGDPASQGSDVPGTTAVIGFCAWAELTRTAITTSELGKKFFTKSPLRFR